MIRYLYWSQRTIARSGDCALAGLAHDGGWEDAEGAQGEPFDRGEGER